MILLAEGRDEAVKAATKGTRMMMMLMWTTGVGIYYDTRAALGAVVVEEGKGAGSEANV